MYYSVSYVLNDADFTGAREISMHLSTFAIGTALLFVVPASFQGCDFRQMTEDRPVKLPAESTDPKDVHPAETKQGSEGATPTRKQ